MRILSTLIAVLSLSIVGFAEEKKEPAKKEPIGQFKHSTGEMDVVLEFKKGGKIDLLVTVGEASATFESKYTIDKEGLVKCELENFVKKGDFPVTKEKGFKYQFKVVTKKGAIVVSEFDGDDVNDNAKKAMEGEYEAVTKK